MYTKELLRKRKRREEREKKGKLITKGASQPAVQVKKVDRKNCEVLYIP
jgi:hypothetical protein